MEARTMMWNAVGVDFGDDNAKTAAEAISQAGLDWDVELRPGGFHNSKGNFVKAKKPQYAVVRNDGEQDIELGWVKSRYKAIQNREVFDFCDGIVDDGGAKYTSAWKIRDGAIVGLTMKLPDTVKIAGYDEHQPYILARTSHDGSTAVTLAVIMERLVCTNEVEVRLRKAQHSLKIRHTANAAMKLQDARHALGVTFDYVDAFAKEMERMMEISVRDDAAKNILTRVFKARRMGEPTIERDVERIIALRQDSPSIAPEIAMTGYGLHQATTEYFDHVRSYRTPEARVLHNLGGLVYKVRNSVHEAVLERV